MSAPFSSSDMRFRLTTPRGALSAVGPLRLGVPGGRAWGIESELIALPFAAELRVTLEVSDPVVREAFVRVAWYSTASRRSRQIATRDSDVVPSGERRTVRLPLKPPTGARALRVRVLARLRTEAARSRDDAIAIVVHARGATPSRTRLVASVA